MTMKLEVTPDVRAGLLAQAQANGLSREASAEKVLRERVSEAVGPDVTRSQLAGQRIRELLKAVTLGGLSIREMMKKGESENG